LDLVAGDRLALADNGYSGYASEDVIVTNYNYLSGKVTLKSGLQFYHWGASESTEAKYGVDMRGEVALLTRNIVVAGDDNYSWGGQILTGSMIEADEFFTQRHGITILDHVEVYNCSQIDTDKAAIRFVGATENWSSITNSAIHNGLGYGVNIKATKNVIM
jgi:hypothetical protein